jgi:2-oxoglutarate ferredoxin oxidoreductase subunit alpha
MRLQAKYRVIEKEEALAEEYNLDGAEYVLVAYGTVARIVKNAIDLAAEKGIKIGLVRPITLWPFPVGVLQKAAGNANVREITAVEMSAGQMVEDVRLSVNGVKPVSLYCRLGSVIPTPEEIVEFIIKKKEGN